MNDEEIRAANKTELFKALEEEGVITIVVLFDGYGDEGQIETMEGRSATGIVALEARCVPFIRGSGDKDECSLADVVEYMVYDYLDRTQGGWQDGEGSYGEFLFDVAKRTITLDFNARFIDSDHSSHEF